MTLINQIISFCPKSARYAPYLEKYMPLYGINTLMRVRHFLAQLAHESGSFVYVKEIASGEKYEGRKDLGNISPGDGKKFKGRGLIQITGRANYQKCSMALFGDKRLIDNPELLERPEWAVVSACWYWKSRDVNKLADSDNIELVSRKINGGLNGIESRKAFYERAKTIMI